MPRPSSRTGAPRRRPGAAHGLAGFTIGVLAVVTGFSFAGTGEDAMPLSEAAQTAERTAAVRMLLERREDADSAAPEAPAEPVSLPQVQPFAADGGAFHPRGATRVVVPSVGIDAEVRPVGYVFRDGRLQYDVPRLEAGQYVGTAAPGSPGNTVIGGHVSNRAGGAVFASLPGVAAGDRVEVHRGDLVFHYTITEIRVVDADAMTVMQPTHDATLTLITCFPHDNYEERLVVVGKLL